MHNPFLLVPPPLLPLLLLCIYVALDFNLPQALEWRRTSVKLTSSSFVCHVKFCYKRKIALFINIFLSTISLVTTSSHRMHRLCNHCALFIGEMERESRAVNVRTIARYCVYVYVYCFTMAVCCTIVMDKCARIMDREKME